MFSFIKRVALTTTFIDKTLLSNQYLINNYFIHTKIMVSPLSQEDFAAMEQQLRKAVADDRQHWRVNDVKCDAIHTARTYEEFADRVAAAHLRPLERADWKKSNRTWNQYAGKDKNDDE